MARKPRRRQYGTGTVVQKHADGPWYPKRRANGVQLYGKPCATREEALEVLRRLVAEDPDPAGNGEGGPAADPVLATLFPMWMEKRKKRVSSWKDDESRWKCHLKDAFGHMRAGEVDDFAIRRFIEDRTGLIDVATVRKCVMLLSSFYSHYLIPEYARGLRYAKSNPVRGLDKVVRKLLHKVVDKKKTVFVRSLADVRAILEKLGEPYRTAYAIGAYTGARIGEILGLHWEDVDLVRRTIYLWQQVTRNQLKPHLKDKDSRFVPVTDDLYPILCAWKLRTGGVGPCFMAKPSLGQPRWKDLHSMNKHLKAALKELGVVLEAGNKWHCATRHTFGSHWANGGRGMRKLQEMFGHSSIATTERYAHNEPGKYSAADLAGFGAKAVQGRYDLVQDWSSEANDAKGENAKKV